MKGVQENAFSLKEVSNESVLKKLKALNPSKATGHDNIPARFLKDSAEIISPQITHIINLSIKQGTFPQIFKIARVTPLYKKGSKLLATTDLFPYSVPFPRLWKESYMNK